jgi:NitT/TauT family transport system substrate-binding protein
MIRRALTILIVIAGFSNLAAAQERVTVAAMRDGANGALFLAAARGYFKAEGLDLEMIAYSSESDVAVALAAGAADLGIAKFTVEAFTYAGRGNIRVIAAQTREKADYDGSELVASNAAYDRGLRKPEQLAGRSAAISALGSISHYQLSRIAATKGFDFASITLKPQGSVDAVARAIANGDADAAVLPGDSARALLASGQAKLIAWMSQMDELQLGALFASSRSIQNRRAIFEKFLRGYRRGTAAYYEALMRHDRFGKRRSNAASAEAAAQIARYVYPGKATGGAMIEADAYYIDPQARLDAADIERQVRWYQAQGLVDKEFRPADVMDLSFK